MRDTASTVFVPDLYFTRDLTACDFIVDSVQHQEPCAVVSMPDNGKNYLFINAAKRLANTTLVHGVEVHKLFSDTELRAVLDAMNISDQPTVYMLYVDMAQDVSWFIHELSNLRKLKDHSFVSVLFCHVGNTWQALLDGESAVMHGQIRLQPVSFEDAVRYIDIEAARFNFHPSDMQKRDIYEWSHGHAGLIKTLLLLKRQYPAQRFTAGFLLSQAPVAERLQKILRDLPAMQKSLLLKGQLAPAERTILEAFGYIDTNGKVFNPLLVQQGMEAKVRRESSLSLTEAEVLGYMSARPNTVVSREDVAAVMWGRQAWADKYSDWAIGQLIYRLRKKLQYSRSGMIETRKGRGFEFIPNEGKGQ